MPCASQSSTRTPAACAPCARPVTRPLSCGEIVPVFRFRCLFQELFHRNYEDGQPKLAILSLESSRPLRKGPIYYVQPTILNHSEIR